MRLALAQLNVIVGDLAGNSARIVAAIGEARAPEPISSSSPSWL